MEPGSALSCPACDAPVGRSPKYPDSWAGPDARGGSYYLCPVCGLVFLDPSKRLDAEAERERYLLHKNSLDNAGYRKMLENFIDAALMPYLRPPQAVLDYGSGPEPSMGVLLRERGYSAFSWDPFFSPIRESRTGPIAAVIMHEVLEHCFSPTFALRDAAAVLSRGGILAVSTRLRPLGPDEFIHWWYREDPTHVSFFTSDCLSLIGRDAGFEVVWEDGKSISVFRKADSRIA
jgi:hypothetical protein